MIKTCAVSGKAFEITEDDLKFYEKMGVPEPTLCPEERRRIRWSWGTFRSLHKRKCDATGKVIISMYAPDAKHPVFHSQYWWSDKWDALDYGQDFDFKRPFFEQFDELLKKVPVMHHSVIHSENCEYINMAGSCKNCYLSFGLDFGEDCFFIQDAQYNKSCLDCLGIHHSELCYECVDCEKSYNLKFSQRSSNCHDSYFLTDCRNCSNCIGCFNLTNKEFHVFNKKVSEEEFKELKTQLKSQIKISETQKYLKNFNIQFPKKYYSGHSNEEFSGDYIRNLKNSYSCFNCHDLENTKYIDSAFQVDNSMDLSIYGEKSSWLYNCMQTGDQCSNNICCMRCWTGSSDNAYCHLIINTKNCFGCSGLKNKQYCIFNKQYTKEEYFTLRERIVEHMKATGEWGEFFPIELSSFSYNESVAQEYLPLTKEECINRGWKWGEDKEATKYTGPKYDIPDMVTDVSDDIIKSILECESCKKYYRLVKPELDFYRKMDLPIPHNCHNCRHKTRMKLRNPRTLFDRKCDNCQTEIQTTFAPDRPEKVYCEKCYLNALN